MRKLLLFLLAAAGICHAQVNLTSSMTTSQLQTAINGAGSGATINFAAGTYPTGTLSFPCTGAKVYKGVGAGQPKISYVGLGSGINGSNMTLSSLPTAILVPPNQSSFAITVPANGTGNATPGSGCTIEGLGFNGNGGGVYVSIGSSGVLLQYNGFTNNNPAPTGNQGGIGLSGIEFDGTTNSVVASGGISNSTVQWNSFYNNCFLIAKAQYSGAPNSGGDNGGLCGAVHVQSYNNGVTIINNIVNGTEQGFKFFEQTAKFTVSNSSDVENNNLQGNERILYEDQQSSNGSKIISHNAFYQPQFPWANTFEISVPLFQCNGQFSTCGANHTPASTINDNAIILNVPVTIAGSGGHYGIAIEQWGQGSISQYNLIQGGNGADTCAAGFSCTGSQYSIGEAFTNANNTNNIGSGFDIFHAGLFGYEDGGSPSNPGIVLTPNTIQQTSVAQVTQAPAISPNGGNFTNVTLTDSDTNHRLSLFYTTDGSTPCIFAPGNSCGTTRLYTGTFSITLPSTVCAIAHWGAGANQGIVFPAFGWVPSSKTCASFAGSGGGPPAQTGITVSCPLGTSVNVGSSLTCQANCSYVGVSTPTNCSTPDQYGTDATFQSSATGDFTVNASGIISGVAAGTANLTASAGGFTSSPLAITVNAPVATLTGVRISAPSTLQVGQTAQATPTCLFSNGSSNNCAVPSGVGCTGIGNVCSSIGQPSGMLLITSYGASTGASAATNTSAILACDTAAISGSVSCFIPAGTYNVNAFTWTGPAGLYGAGAGSSILNGTADTNCQITMSGNSWTFSGWTHICPQTTRDSTHWNIFVGRTITGFRVDSMELQGGDAGGFINFFSDHGTYTNNYVHDTLADCLYTTDGSNNMIVANNKMRNCGDDSISNVSYTGDADGIVSNNLDQNNDVGFQSNGRGITVVGGQNITIQGNAVASTTQNACIYLADEPSFNSRAVSNIAVLNNAMNACSGSTGQPGLLAYAGQGTVSDILVQGNTISSPVHDGMGTISATGGVVSNIAFITNAITSPGSGTAISNSGSTGNTYCSGNTLGGSAVAGGSCGGTNSFTPTGTTLTCCGSLTLSWASGAPLVASISQTGGISALTAGTAGLTVSTGGLTSPAQNLQVTSASPPAATLTGVNLLGVPASIAPTQVINLTAQCTYSDGTTTTCNGADSHGTTASGWTSSSTGTATLVAGVLTGVAGGTTNLSVSAGAFTSSLVPLTVVAPPTLNICGNNQVTPSFAGSTAANYENAVYCVTPSGGSGWAVSSCSFFLPAGTQTSGANWDCLVTPATSTTAQAAAPVCVGTYTTNSTSSPAVWVNAPMGQVGNPSKTCILSAATAYWIGTVTNGGGTPPQGFWNCGSTCSGSAPSVGNGTYKYFYISQNYGSYAGNSTALNPNGGATLYQTSEYVTLASPPPTLVGGFLQTVPTNGVNALVVGSTTMFAAYCSYSDGTVFRCDAGGDVDPYGNTVTAWTSDTPSVATIGDIGSAHPGLATAVTGGSADVHATLTGSVPTNPWTLGITNPPTTSLPGAVKIFRPR